MDYIYRCLSRELSRKNLSPRDESVAQERIYLYLTRIISSEFWWRLRCQDKNSTAEKIGKAQNAKATLDQLRSSAPTAIPNLDRLITYKTLLEKLDGIRMIRNNITHNDGLRLLDDTELELVEENRKILIGVRQLLRSDDIPVGLSSAWTPMIPVGTQEGKLVCMCYHSIQNEFTDETEYLWEEELLDPDTPEFRRDGLKSKSHMQEKRLYFRKAAPANVFGSAPEICCAYPFVQIGWNTAKNDLDRIWFFDAVENWLNGHCRGTDILATSRDGEIDREYIRELIASKQCSDNIYLIEAKVDQHKNAYPIRNVYEDNYPKWMDNVSASRTITKVKAYLDGSASVVYVFGKGGIGKTATVQHMLKTAYYKARKGGPIYDYIIFLSAKEREWKNNDMSEVEYANGRQSFQDLDTLRQCLCNIFGNSAGCSHDPKDDEKWYSGKSILLVLDDLESVDNAKWPPISDYLDQHFTATMGKKKRQVIITCRNMPMEGFAANVKQDAMSESDSAAFAIFCADVMGENRGVYYRQALGEGADDSMLTGNQKANRELLIKLTQGLPLIIRVLVFAVKNAALTADMSADPDLLQYLYKDTYRYLSTDEQRKLAFIAAILTSEAPSCATERLQFVWNYEEQGGYCNISDMVKNLCDYGVLATTEDEKNFSFPLENMRQYIEQGFASDEHREQILPQKSQQLAYWLGKYHRYSTEQCLMQHLRNTVAQWYEQLNLNGCAPETDDLTDIALLKNMVHLYSAICKAARPGSYLIRAAMQMIVQVYRDGSRGIDELQDVIEGTSDAYFTESFRGHLNVYSDVLKDDSSSKTVQNLLVNHLKNIDQHSGKDNRNRLLILWNTMLLIQDIHSTGARIIAELPSCLDHACRGCASKFDKISDADRTAFVAQMEKTIALFSNQMPHQTRTLNSMRSRCGEMKVSFADSAGQNSENIFFLSPL